MIKDLELGTNPENLPQAVFIAIIAESKVWLNYEGISEAAKQTVVPQALMIQRWDGMKGFIGGQVEECESLKTAVRRECLEEINFNITNEELTNSKFISTHSTGNLVTHLIAINVSPERMREAVSGSHNAIHSGSEVVGVMPVPFINYPHMPSFDNFMRNNFAPTVKEEIVRMVKVLGWDEKYNLPNLEN